MENGLKEELLEDGSDEDLDLELRLNFGFWLEFWVRFLEVAWAVELLQIEEEQEAEAEAEAEEMAANAVDAAFLPWAGKLTTILNPACKKRTL